MQTGDHSDTKDHSVISAVSFIAGFILTAVGYRNFSRFDSEINMSLDLNTGLLPVFTIILGIAFLISGFLGLARGKIL